MGQSRMRIANWWYSRKEYSIAVKCYKKALQYYNNIPTNQVSFVRTWRKSTLGAYPLFHWDYRLWATHPQHCLGKLSHKVTRKRNQTHLSVCLQECSTAEEYKELLALMEERLRVMRQVANIFKRIANLIQSGTIDTWDFIKDKCNPWGLVKY